MNFKKVPEFKKILDNTFFYSKLNNYLNNLRIKHNVIKRSLYFDYRAVNPKLA
ncbi:hypothetical protein Mh1950_21850 [Mannheimia haemolytica]